LKTILSYNASEVKTDGSLEDLANGYNIWIDFTDPEHDELLTVASRFNLDRGALETCFNKSKKPEIRILDNHKFTLILDIKNKDPKTLESEGIYIFLGRQWMITVHSNIVNLKDMVEKLFKVNNRIKELQIDALYYSLFAEIVTRYEQLLTAIELSVNEYQRRSFARPSASIFENIDLLSRHTIILRRYFWRVRNIINFLVHQEHDKKEVKYIEMVYNDVTQLIDFVESYENTINSIRELYVAKVSLQINDTMKILTLFTVILLPLTLIAGIYGMNGIDLNNIEAIPLGFILVIITMACIGVGLLFFFIKKQWLLRREKEPNSISQHQRNGIHKDGKKESHVDYYIFNGE
jgi:magnesium transporter